MHTILGSDEKNLVFVENPTTGINAVMASIQLSPQDTILMSTHTYNAVKNIVWATAHKSGAKVLTVDLPSPITSEEQIIQVTMHFLTARLERLGKSCKNKIEKNVHT